MKVGIDLGTTFSLITRMGSGGSVIYIPDITYRQNLFTPSIVNFNNETALVGLFAESYLEQNPDHPAIRFFKRNFGEQKPLFYDSKGTPWYPDTIGALVLKKLKADAEGYASEMLDGAVITIPAHFSDPQRKSVLNAAFMAGIPVLGLVEEPVAAALHYGITENTMDKLILVYDLGGGTFDVTLLSMNEKGVFVLAKDGLTELGGKEFDERIGEIILKQYWHHYGKETEPDAKFLLNLRKVSEQIKIELGMPGTRFVKKMCLLGNKPFEAYVTADEFEKAIAPHVENTVEVLLRCIKSASIGTEDIDSVIMVGGSSMVPLIKNRIHQIFHKDTQKVLFHNPMKAVAAGAAMHVCQLDGDAAKYNIPPELKGVCGYNTGIRSIDSATGRVKIDTLISKNTPLPVTVCKTYYTTHPLQEKMLLDFVQYIDKTTAPISLGNMVILLNRGTERNYPIEVTIENTINGTVNVKAFDPQTGQQLNQTFGMHGAESNYLYTQKALVNNITINCLV
ncbi:MAG: Hsp70 family protein [Bacteroidota bacterium]